MRTIYTSVKGISIFGCNVVHVSDMTAEQRIWVEARTHQLLMHTTLPERITARMLAKMEEKPIRQAFFQIRGRAYFLDFFFPNKMIAVEIDGSSHKYRRETDKRRDADFRSIGIRTIRIKNKDVMNGNLYDKLFKRMFG